MRISDWSSDVCSSDLFSEQGSIVYTFIYGLVLATVLMLPAGLVIGRYAYRFIVTVPKALLVPTVAFLTVIGSYAIRHSIPDVALTILLGVMGWVPGRFGVAASPIVLGTILGPPADPGLLPGRTP